MIVGRHALAVLFGVLLLSRAATVSAEARPPHAWLSWQAPPACATRDDIQRKLSLLVQRPVIWSDAGEGQGFSIIANAWSAGATWQARVTLRHARLPGRTLGTRDVASRTDDCRELDVPVALVMATLLDGLWEELANIEAPPRMAAVGVFGGAELGLGPKPWGFAGLRFELPGRLPIGFVATLYPPTSELDDLGRGAHYAAAHGGGAVCPTLWTIAAGPALRLCGELQAGVVWASGAGLSIGHRRVLPLALIDVAPTLELPLSERLFAQVSIFGGWMMLRPRFEWAVAGMPWHVQPEPWMLGARISLMGRLP